MTDRGLQASSEEIARYNYERTWDHASHIARFRYVLDMCADDRTFWTGYQQANADSQTVQSEIWHFKYFELAMLCRRKVNVKTCQAKRQAGYPDAVMEALLVDNFPLGLEELRRGLHEATIATELRRENLQRDEIEIGARVTCALQDTNTANNTNPEVVSNYDTVPCMQTPQIVGHPIQEVKSEKEASVGNPEPGTEETEADSRVKRKSLSSPF